MDLGNTIKTIRKRKEIKQNSFAELCGISQTYLSQIENNQKEPNISVLKTICSHLNVSLPILFFLSLDDNDVPEKKKQAFAIVGPTVKTLLNELLYD
ncbi:MAG TPA: helix-turn-helix transcriptional regulator [Chitinophagaceae bacterium]|jgi:transcriptional regulator with XRE-family HTH domain|nr:helix-turn-helix transcriptional regulator [Chitinophagaceae bacterium]